MRLNDVASVTIILAYPYAVWYGLEAIWKLGLWKLGRNLRRARSRQVQDDMQQEKVQDAG